MTRQMREKFSASTSNQEKTGNSRQNIPAVGIIRQSKKVSPGRLFYHLRDSVHGRRSDGNPVVSHCITTLCIVYHYNRFFVRIGKIVKIEKYVPFRTSGNRNLYLGCNRRHAKSGRNRNEPFSNEKFVATETVPSRNGRCEEQHRVSRPFLHGMVRGRFLATTSRFDCGMNRKSKRLAKMRCSGHIVRRDAT
jgi:hypothetical protein